jgi:SAM-dependent methyltransferase
MRPRVRTFPPVRAVWRALGRRDELKFWRGHPQFVSDGRREHAFTEWFGVERDWYAGKRMLDVGCGPRGSLDWATDAEVRVGLDPLAERYLELGVDATAMEYVRGVAEMLPFGDDEFDVVSTINSLDHVDDVPSAAAEMVRVLRPGGLLLIVTELNHRPRLTEPQSFGWEVLDTFVPPLEALEERRLACSDRGIDASVAAGVPYEHGPGVLVAKLRAPISTR